MKAYELKNPSERLYAALLEAQGIAWERPKDRLFPFDGTSYTPDFYLPETGIYVEIIGTRQRWSQCREKIEAFRTHYPHINLLVLHGDGTAYPPSYEEIERKPKPPIPSKEAHSLPPRISGVPLTSSEMGRIGGTRRAERLSPERRSEIARMGGLAKSAKRA